MQRSVSKLVLRRSSSVEDRCPFRFFRYSPSNPRLISQAVEQKYFVAVMRSNSICELGRNIMGRGILLWLIGVPIPIIILLALFFH
jgi:hypothetical protein